jgi:hypothetical protein
MTRTITIAALFVFCVQALPGAQLSVATHAAILREGSTAWLLRVDGAGLDTQLGSGEPRPAIEFREKSGAVFRWPRTPGSFARWDGGWLVVNGDRALYRFTAGGIFAGRIPVSIMVTDIVSANGRLWIYSAAPDASLLVAETGLEFRPVPGRNTRDELSAVQKALDAIIIVAAGQRQSFLYTHLIGPPTLYHVTRTGRTQTSLAYRRTSRRAALTEARTGTAELDYSSPARDLLVTSADEVLVLRNLEDEPKAGGVKTEPFVGRRADVYRLPDGAHMGTATFAETVRWLLRVSGKSVVAIARSGRIVEARIGQPLAGSILP